MHKYSIGTIVLSTIMIICSTGVFITEYKHYLYNHQNSNPDAEDMFNHVDYGFLPHILPVILGFIGVLSTVINNPKIIKLALISFVVTTIVWATLDMYYQFAFRWGLEYLGIIYEATELTFIALIIWIIKTHIQDDEKTDPLL